MPGAIVKDLYLGKNVGDLNKLAGDFPKVNNVRLYIKSADKVYKSAEEMSMLGDEEKSYVFYMKYFNIISAIKKTAEYKKSESYFKELIGMKNCMKAINEAERLSGRLNERYEEKEAKDVVEKLEALEKKEAEAAKKKEQEEEEKAQEEERSQDAKTVASEAPPKQSLGSEELYRLLRDEAVSLLLIDIRSADDFFASHLNHRSCINLPAEHIPPGCTVRQLEQHVPAEYKAQWLARGSADSIILLGWRSSVKQLVMNEPLNSLKDALYKWDQETLLRSEPLVLEGGYVDWLLYYPMLTTNPNVTRPKPDNNTSLLPSLESIQYDLDSDLLKTDEERQAERLRQQEAQKQAALKEAQQEAQRRAELMAANTNTQTTRKDTNKSVKPLNVPSVDRSSKPALNNVTNTESRTEVPGKLNNVLQEGKHEKNTNITHQGRTPNTATANGPSSGPANGPSSANGPSPANRPSAGLSGGPQTVTTTTPMMPSVDRSKKPKTSKEESPDDKNETTDAQVSPSEPPAGRTSDVSGVNTQPLVLEHQARVARLEQVKEETEQLLKLKQKEARETAELMRRKRQVEEELEAAQQRLRGRQEDGSAEEVVDVVSADDVDPLSQDGLHKEERVRTEDKIINEEKENEERQRKAMKEKKTDEKAAQEREERRRAEEKAAKEEERRRQEEQREKDEKRRQDEQREKDDKRRQDEQKQRDEQRRREEQRRKEEQRHEDEQRRKEEQRRQDEQRRKDEQRRQEEQQRIAKEKAAKEEELKRQEELKKEEEQRAAREEKQKRQEEQRKQATERAAEEERNKQITKQQATRPQGTHNTPGLPVGWEKKLDPSTGRYFYVNHASKRTQWDAPASQPDVTAGGSYKTKLKEEPTSGPASSLKRSHSTPNIAKMLADEADTETKPQINRTAKPQVADRDRVVMTINTDVSAAKVRNLNPVWGSVGRGLCGLRNVGNTCYLNSIIQCLSSTVPLTVYFLNDNYRHHINKENVFGKGGLIAEEYAVVIKGLWSGQHRCITPRDLWTVLGRFYTLFASHEHQDSQELLLFLMDGLHEDLNEVKRRPQLPEQNNDGVPDEKAAKMAWEMHKKINRSIVVELFQGQFKSTVMCLTCHKKSVTFDVFVNLSLPIPSGSRCTLADCLAYFSKEERMSGECRWDCPRCQRKRDAVKNIVIWKLPPVLLIHLKRFYYQGVWRDKITSYVDFPLDNLDMTRNVMGPRPGAPYNLYAVSNHFGTLDGGHYTAAARNPNNKRWYKFDDSDVSETSKSNVKSAAAYILYYTNLDMGTILK